MKYRPFFCSWPWCKKLAWFNCSSCYRAFCSRKHINPHRSDCVKLGSSWHPKAVFDNVGIRVA